MAPRSGVLGKARQLRRLTQEDEVTREVIGTRCERGAEIARMLEPPVATQEAIREQRSTSAASPGPSRV